MSGIVTESHITDEPVVKGFRGQTPVVASAATLTVTAAEHAGRTVVLSRAAGIAVALPAATGSGDKYRFVVGITASGGSYVITRAGSDTMFGNAIQSQDSAATLQMFEAAGSTTITLNGSSQSGIKGDIIELEDILAATWSVRIVAAGTGSEATPFS